jgi:MFS family permease
MSSPNLRRRLLATFAGLPGSFWALWSATLIDRLGGFVYPFLALYLTSSRGLGADEVGLVLSVGGAGAFAGALAGGILADQLGRKVTLVAGLLGSAALLLVLGLVERPVVIAGVFGAFGFVGGVVRPAVSALTADIVPAEQRLRAFGLLHWAVNLGFSVAPVLAGVLARRGYLVLFVLDAATTCVCAALIWARVPGGPPPPSTEPMWRGLTRAFRDAPFVLFLGLTFLVAMIYTQVEVALPIDMSQKGIGPDSYGLVLAVNGVLITLLAPLLAGALADAPPARVLGAAGLLTGIGFGLHGLASTAWMYAGAVAVWTIGEILFTPASGAVIVGLAPVDQRGRYSGANAMCWSLARTLGPTGGGLMLARLGSGWLWSACLALGLVVALGQLGTGAALAARLRKSP